MGRGIPAEQMTGAEVRPRFVSRGSAVRADVASPVDLGFDPLLERGRPAGAGRSGVRDDARGHAMQRATPVPFVRPGKVIGRPSGRAAFLAPATAFLMG
jgi:hypothetical protein